MWNLNDFILDVRTLNRLIRIHDIPVSKEKLNELESCLENEEKDLSHVIENIEFTLDEKISKTIPVEVYGFTFFLSINFILNYDKNFEIEDPFFNDKTMWGEKSIDSYSLQLEINGYSTAHDDVLYNFWHLDRHITGDGQSKVDHPFYHFQNGGTKMSPYNNHIEVAVFTGAPRIPHPPMDIFLAFHFVISNFYNRNSSKNIESLLSDEDYIELIERAQVRMWKPYYESFRNEVHSDYTLGNITPLYTVH